MNVVFESDLNTPKGISLRRLVLDLPTEWTPLADVCDAIIKAGHATDKADAQQAIERACQFGLAEWCPHAVMPKPGLYVRRCEVVYRTEQERRLIAGRVWHTDTNGDTTAFNFDPDDPMYKLRKSGKPRWTAAEKRARAEAEAAKDKRSKPSRLRKLFGK